MNQAAGPTHKATGLDNNVEPPDSTATVLGDWCVITCKLKTTLEPACPFDQSMPEAVAIHAMASTRVIQEIKRTPCQLGPLTINKGI